MFVKYLELISYRDFFSCATEISFFTCTSTTKVIFDIFGSNNSSTPISKSDISFKGYIIDSKQLTNVLP